MKKKPEFHGSDLEKIADYYHLNKENIILFGANVNPLGLSGQVKKDLAEHLDIISSYPDRDYTDLKKAIAAYTNTSPEHIVVGNGSTELISLLISQRAPKRALLLGPTYSEYARELNLVGGTLEYYNLKEEQDFRLDISDLTDTLKSDIDLLIICNPNNALCSKGIYSAFPLSARFFKNSRAGSLVRASRRSAAASSSVMFFASGTMLSKTAPRTIRRWLRVLRSSLDSF